MHATVEPRWVRGGGLAVISVATRRLPRLCSPECEAEPYSRGRMGHRPSCAWRDRELGSLAPHPALHFVMGLDAWRGVESPFYFSNNDSHLKEGSESRRGVRCASERREKCASERTIGARGIIGRHRHRGRGRQLASYSSQRHRHHPGQMHQRHRHRGRGDSLGATHRSGTSTIEARGINGTDIGVAADSLRATRRSGTGTIGGQ